MGTPRVGSAAAVVSTFPRSAESAFVAAIRGISSLFEAEFDCVPPFALPRSADRDCRRAPASEIFAPPFATEGGGDSRRGDEDREKDRDEVRGEGRTMAGVEAGPSSAAAFSLSAGALAGG